jgi:uncharacterized protein YqgC (DUF456 family)
VRWKCRRWSSSPLEIFLKILAVLLVAAGVAGTVVPAMPGPFLTLTGLFLFAWSDGFSQTGWWTMGVVTAFTLATAGVDFIATALGAGRVGASRRAMAGAIIGTFAGLFFGLPGLIIGPFIGALAGELSVRRDLSAASRAGFGVWLGLLVGAVVKLGLVAAAIGVFFAAYVF